MNIKRVKTAISLLKSMVESGESHSLKSQEVIAEALHEIKKYEDCKVRWFRVCGDGSIGAMTTPKGHGQKILCKIVHVDAEIKICPNCGHAVTEGEEE